MKSIKIVPRGFFICGVFLLLAVSPQAKGEPEIQVLVKPSGKIKVGDPLQLAIQLTWKSGEGDYRFIVPQLRLERLKIEQMGESNEVFQKEGENWKKKIFEFTLTADQAGKGQILPFRLGYTEATSQAAGSFEIEPLVAEIIPNRTKLYTGVTISVGSVGFIGFLVWWLYGLRLKKVRETARNAPKSLEEEYGSRISKLMENQESIKSFADILSEAIKLFYRYFSQKYSVNNPPVTGVEMGERLKEKIETDEMKKLKALFLRLDEWRFADTRHTEDTARALYLEIAAYLDGKKTILV